MVPRTILAIDEAQMILPATGGGHVARAAVESYVLEGRNFGLSMWLATQRPRGAISERAVSQLDTLIVHRLSTGDDVAAVIQLMQSKEPNPIKVNDRLADLTELIRSLDVGMALISADKSNTGRGLPLSRCAPELSLMGAVRSSSYTSRHSTMIPVPVLQLQSRLPTTPRFSKIAILDSERRSGRQRGSAATDRVSVPSLRGYQKHAATKGVAWSARPPPKTYGGTPFEGEHIRSRRTPAAARDSLVAAGILVSAT